MTVIIDCTELFLLKSLNFSVKILVGIIPMAVTFHIVIKESESDKLISEELGSFCNFAT